MRLDLTDQQRWRRDRNIAGLVTGLIIMLAGAAMLAPPPVRLALLVAPVT